MTLNNHQQRIYVMPDQPQTNCGEVMTTSATESTMSVDKSTSVANQCQLKICLLKVSVPV
uniref:Uncharacterized protein n=1 Tax=Romanomermis culicivorax TaxID=13658 RepID=A0A915HTV1_ROMCU